MYYTNFDEHITTNWRIICVAWPLQNFCSPADLKSRNEVQVLYNAWKSGVTRFEQLSVEAFEKWEEARFHAVLGQTLHEDGEDEALDSANPRGYDAADGDDIEIADADAGVVPRTVTNIFSTTLFSLLSPLDTHAPSQQQMPHAPSSSHPLYPYRTRCGTTISPPPQIPTPQCLDPRDEQTMFSRRMEPARQ